MDSGKRLVVFTGDLAYSVRRNIIDLDDRLPGLTWLILLHQPPKSLSRRLKNLRTNVRKNGWRWIPYLAGEVASRLFGSLAPKASPQAPGGEYEEEALLARPHVRIVRTADIHSAECLELLRQFDADLGLSLAAPILKPALFDLPRWGTINLHKGRLPQFRGMPPAFWELWTDQDSVGCSVHRVNERLDEGDLLAEDTVPRHRFSDQRGLQLRLDEVGSELVCQVAADILSGQSPKGFQPAGEGKTWRKPTLMQQSQLRAKLAALNPSGKSPIKSLVKNSLARIEWAWHHWLGWRLRQPRVTVLLYHRVTDEVRDNLTVGVSQFERQMQLLRKHCDVLDIEQVTSMQLVPRSRRPLVAVTFDDGYLDNHDNAAAILRRHRVPCAFFVSTGLISEQRRFPHDIRRGNPVIPTMTWPQLAAMSRWGFVIGSHTVSHIDCVAEDASKVMSELSDSRDALRRELKRSNLIFAYPYGGRHQMNQERLELVRKTGYSACLSAYGGSNISQVDRWNVKRRGINWEFSDAAFLQQCLGR